MNIAEMLNRTRLLSFSKIVFKSFLIILAFSIPVNAQGNSKAAQWGSAGGEKILSGNHKFTTSWASDANSRRDGNKWWRGFFWGNAARWDKGQHTPWENTVRNSVAPKKGQITVQGPGNIGLFQRCKGARIHATPTKPWPGFTPWTNTISWQGDKWVGTVKDYNPVGEFFGFIPAEKEVTVDITAKMLEYNNQNLTGERSFGAPQEIEYELWFFPREGGKVIKVIKYGPNGEEIDVTPGKVVKDNVDDLPPGAAGYIMSIMGSKAGKIIRFETESDFIGVELKKGDIIYFGDILTTHDVMVKIILSHYPDKPLVMLKANTKIRLENKEKEKKGGIFSFFGKLFFKGNGKDHQGFKIVTSNAIAGSSDNEEDVVHRGTIRPEYIPRERNIKENLNISSYEVDYDPITSKTTVSVFEGTVRLECTKGVINPVMVNAGMQATMDNNCNHTLSILDPDNKTAAKAGWEIDDKPGTIDDKRDGDIARIVPNSDSHVYAYSYRNWNKSNWGKYENIGAGWNPTGGEKRAFLKFDLAGIDPNSVNKATLKLFHNHTGGGNAVELGVYRVMSPWQEGSGTYHSGQTEKPASSGEISWVDQPEIDRYPVVSFNPGPGVNKWVEVDITSLIKAWLTGVPNHGMAIKGRDNLSGKPESQYGFRSREFVDASKRPHLVLNGSSSKGSINGGKVNSSAIVGKWKWFTDVIVTIYSDGRVSWSNGTGMWKKDINGSTYEYVINWDNGYVDRLNLTGQTLKGVNQNGTPVWGERIKSNSF